MISNFFQDAWKRRLRLESVSTKQGGQIVQLTWKARRSKWDSCISYTSSLRSPTYLCPTITMPFPWTHSQVFSMPDSVPFPYRRRVSNHRKRVSSGPGSCCKSSVDLRGGIFTAKHISIQDVESSARFLRSLLRSCPIVPR